MMARNIIECEDGREHNNVLMVTENNNRKEIDFYLTGEIKDITDYIDLMRELESCREGDMATIHINCYGGYADVALNLYDILKSSDAEVVISVEGACCSCASMIMLGGDAWRITPHSYVMIHSWSGGLFGKYHEMDACFEYSKKFVNSHFKEIYKNFLTEDELEQCLGGKDFWFDSSETAKRINNYRKEDAEISESIRKIADKYSSMADKEINEFLKNPVSSKDKKKGGKKQ